MKEQHIDIGGIPAIIYGEPAGAVYIYVHGKMSCKESAQDMACIAAERGFQVLAFDLPGHGERIPAGEACDVWNGMRDLGMIGSYARQHWQRMSLYACSLGAFFSLMTYADMPFEKCLFLSPIADMGRLIEDMFTWFGVTPERLEREGEIPTPVDTLSWKYYQYVLAHPVERWPFPTSILHATGDNLQSSATIARFARRFGCDVTEAQGAEHPFMDGDQPAFVHEWLLSHV